MINLTLKEEKDAVDYITNCMFSVSFLESISNFIFSPKRDALTVGQFYDQWLRKIGVKEQKIPFNPGAFLGYLYCGILYGKENWYELIPDESIDSSSPKWGLNKSFPIAPECRNLTIRYVFKRIRNSLAHGIAIIDVPENISKEEMFRKITFTFKDINTQRTTDTFEITLSMGQLTKLVKKFQGIIHSYVRRK